jgi:hypothetical protein
MSRLRISFGSITVIPDDTDWVSLALASKLRRKSQSRKAGPGVANRSCHAPDSGHLSGIQSALYVWEPPTWAEDQLPTGFRLRMCCVTFPDGVRRFYPAEHIDRWLGRAFEGGLALLNRHQSLTAEGRSWYRELFLLFGRARKTREHLRNKLIYPKSLRVAARGRGLEEVWSILPDRPEFRREDGRKLTVGELIHRGKQELRAQGREHSSLIDCVVYGLLHSARSCRSGDVPAQQIPDLVRCALYDSPLLERHQRVDDATVQLVRERLHRALKPHLGDPQGSFETWFAGAKNSLLEQLCKPTAASPGRLDRRLAKRVLLDLGWRAYQCVAQCILMMMWAISRSLPGGLTEAERRDYEGMYFPQPYLGGLPLVLLLERLPLLQPILGRLWEAPDD